MADFSEQGQKIAVLNPPQYIMGFAEMIDRIA